MTSCQEAPELISALLDDELTFDERLALEAHLADCACCRELEASFRRIDDRVRCELPESGPLRMEPRRTGLSQPAGWLSVVGVAAVILLSVTVVMMRTPQASAQSTLAPLTEANQINQHKRAAQDTMLETLEWELRALRLDLGKLEADPDQRAAIASRLESLLREVDQAKQRDS